MRKPGADRTGADPTDVPVVGVAKVSEAVSRRASKGTFADAPLALTTTASHASSVSLEQLGA